MSTIEVTDVRVIRAIFSYLMMLFLFYKKGALFCKSPKKILNNCFCCFRHCYCHFHSHCLCMNACDCLFMYACLCHCLCLYVGRVKSRHHSDHLSGRTHISSACCVTMWLGVDTLHSVVFLVCKYRRGELSSPSYSLTAIPFPLIKYHKVFDPSSSSTVHVQAALQRVRGLVSWPNNTFCEYFKDIQEEIYSRANKKSQVYSFT